MADNMLKSRISILVNIARIDGEFAPVERDFIGKLAKRSGMSSDEIDNCLSDPDTLEDLDFITELAMDEKFEIIHSIVLLMNADGKLNKEEINYCLKVARMLGYRESVLFEFITSVTNGQEIDIEKRTLKSKIQHYLDS